MLSLLSFWNWHIEIWRRLGFRSEGGLDEPLPLLPEKGISSKRKAQVLPSPDLGFFSV
jgi:hypothetical protein